MGLKSRSAVLILLLGIAVAEIPQDKNDYSSQETNKGLQGSPSERKTPHDDTLKEVPSEKTIHNTVPKVTPSGKTPQDLKSFFNSDIKPLSFAYFDQNDAVEKEPTPWDSDEGQNPFEGVAAASSLDNIMMGIRDLKLTIADMDEKLEKVVQRIAPNNGNPSIMSKGSQMFRNMFSLPYPNPTKTPYVTGSRGLEEKLKDRNDYGVGLKFRH